MTKSLYDRPTHAVGRHSDMRGIGDYDELGGSNYDAKKVAEDKFYRSPEKYTHSRRSYTTDNRTYGTRGNGRVTVVVEHWYGCIGQGVCDDIRRTVEESFSDVKFMEVTGRLDSFEVFVNGKLLYSRIMQGGYPYEEEVLEAVYRARKGKEVHQLDRGESRTCTIV